MAAKRKSELKSNKPSGVPDRRNGLKPVLAPIATALPEELPALGDTAFLFEVHAVER